MELNELPDKDTHLPQTSSIHFDFRPIKIRVYKNGDELDEGKEVAVTRREFKHWVIFLDGLTKKLRTTTAIHRLFTLHGIRLDHFDELEHRGEYVAVQRGPFIHCQYGKVRNWTKDDKKWTALVRTEDSRTPFLHSAEAMDIYLKHEGYGSYTGLPYPFDGILTRSPSTSALHMKGHQEKFGGSLEKLNKVGKNIWSEDEQAGKEGSHNGAETTQAAPSGPILPKLVGLSEAGTAKSDSGEPSEPQSEIVVTAKQQTKLPSIQISNTDQVNEESTKKKETGSSKRKEEPKSPQVSKATKLPPISKESRIPVKVEPPKTEKKVTVRSSRPKWDSPVTVRRAEKKEEIHEQLETDWDIDVGFLDDSSLSLPSRRRFYHSSYHSYHEIHRAFQPFDPDFM